MDDGPPKSVVRMYIADGPKPAVTDAEKGVFTQEDANILILFLNVGRTLDDRRGDGEPSVVEDIYDLVKARIARLVEVPNAAEEDNLRNSCLALLEAGQKMIDSHLEQFTEATVDAACETGPQEDGECLTLTVSELCANGPRVCDVASCRPYLALRELVIDMKSRLARHEKKHAIN